MPGVLYLIPSFIGFADKRLISQKNLEIIHTLKHFIVENEKSARLFLKETATPIAQSEFSIAVMDKHHPESEIKEMLQPVQEGYPMGILSEAGLPCIADPGNLVVNEAHKQGIKVVPLAGLNSLMMALMASGFSGQQFTFHGYLPHDKKERIRKIKEMEREAVKGITQIFMETPYRNQKLFEELVQFCQMQTRLCLASNISFTDEWIVTRNVGEWKKSIPVIDKKPVVFLLGS
jgi:16S rRNA (cytidine1402-2'-O)-methyltransferase